MDGVEPVSAVIRRVGGQVRAEHHTAGTVRMLPGDVDQLDGTAPAAADPGRAAELGPAD